MKIARVLTAVVLGLGLLAAPAVQAQAWPTKPIRYVVPFPPGGSSDVIGRLLAKELQNQLGVPVVVENAAGASGTVGSAQVMRADPDGYTLLHGASSSHGLAAFAMKLSYDPVKDFSHIAMLTKIPNAVVVPSSLGVNTVQELLAYLKANPGTPYGHPGVGSSAYMAGELLRVMAKLELTHVPYKGTAPVVQDILGGQLKLGFGDVVAVAPQVKSGRLKVLAITSTKRSELLPEIPTMSESGISGYEAVVWLSLFAPPGTPKPIVDRLNAEVNRALALSELKSRLGEMGAELMGGTPKEQEDFIAADLKKWGDVIKAGNIKFE